MKRLVRPYLSYGILAVLYVLLNLFITPNAATRQYNLSVDEYRIMITTIILPVVAIWFAAFYGYEKMRAYAQAIRKSPEGPAFSDMANGAAWLAWSLPIPAIISTILLGVGPNHVTLHSAAIIINNYLAIAFALVIFTVIGRATRKLSEVGRVRPTLFGTQVMIGSFVVLGVLYCYFTLHNIEPHVVTNPYHLPLWLILLTVIIPYLYAWFMGLLAAYEISLYSKKSKGIFYRQALHLLSLGVVIVILASIMIQYLSSISPRLSHLRLNSYLIIIYLLLIVYSLGYILIALGAKKLKRIEEV